MSALEESFMKVESKSYHVGMNMTQWQSGLN
jgi:hypothetical protein